MASVLFSLQEANRKALYSLVSCFQQYCTWWLNPRRHFFCVRHNIIIVVPLNNFFIACRTWKIISQYHITIIYKQ